MTQPLHLCQLFDVCPNPMKCIRFEGGAGSSQEDAILLLGTTDDSIGVDAEYRYLSVLLGPENISWKFISSTIRFSDGKTFDILTVRLPSQELRRYFFDITAFFPPQSNS